MAALRAQLAQFSECTVQPQDMEDKRVPEDGEQLHARLLDSIQQLIAEYMERREELAHNLASQE